MYGWCPQVWTLARRVLPAFEKGASIPLCVPPAASTLTPTIWMVSLLPSSRNSPILFPSHKQVSDLLSTHHHYLVLSAFQEALRYDCREGNYFCCLITAFAGLDERPLSFQLDLFLSLEPSMLECSYRWGPLPLFCQVAELVWH